MSIDKSLKVAAGLARARNVLTREERLAILESDDRWVEGRPVLGIPKVRVQKASIGKKKKTTKEEEKPEAKGKKK